MAKTNADEAYKELLSLKIVEKIKGSEKEKMKVLDELFSKINSFKMTFYEFVSYYPEDSLYVLYLLQKNNSIDFNLCRKFKMWNNREGWQYGCELDKGKGKRIQINCKGNIKKCERK
ncbi:MAG: hypothetical protein ACLFPQ_06760 [Candidatus Woesearchaeota archaeon]